MQALPIHIDIGMRRLSTSAAVIAMFSNEGEIPPALEVLWMSAIKHMIPTREEKAQTPVRVVSLPFNTRATPTHITTSTAIKTGAEFILLIGYYTRV